MASIPLPNGAQVALATTFGIAKAISEITNAKPAVVSSAAHGLQDGGIVLLAIPGWSKLDGCVVRVDETDLGTYALPGVDTSNVDHYPVGGAVGSAKSITGWTPMAKIPTFELTGGEAQKGKTAYMDSFRDKGYFTSADAQYLDFTVSYQPDTPAFEALVKASDSREIQVIRMVLPNGDTLFYSGVLFFNKSPTTTKDQEMVNKASLAMEGEITRYAKYVP